MKEEKIINPFNGYYVLLALVLVIGLGIFGIRTQNIPALIVAVPLFLLLSKGLIIISPNNSKVLLLFGAYRGSVKRNGLFWINPFFYTTTLSLRARNFESEKIKVNDKAGNPIMISVILVWRVKDT